MKTNNATLLNCIVWNEQQAKSTRPAVTDADRERFRANALGCYARLNLEPVP